MILQQRRIRKGGSIIMRCAPNQAHWESPYTKMRFGTKRDTLLITEKCQKSFQAMRLKTAPSSVPHPLPEVSTTCGGNPSRGAGCEVSWRLEKESGAILKSEWDEQKENHLNLAPNIHTDTQSISYLVFSCWAVLNPLSPPSATSAGRNFMYTNEEILNKGIGSRSQ